MAVLVTGGAGYIGSHTAVALHESGREVVLIDNFNNSSPAAVEAIRALTTPDLVCVEADLRDRGQLNAVFEAHDIDEVAVDRNYRQMIALGEQNLQPLLLDLTNPSPGLGWANEERSSLLARKQIDVGLALALIHHIAISNNVPLERAAAFFQTLCRQLIIEFVPKADSQVKRLLSTREDVFPNYTQEGFEQAFSQYFTITEAVPITGTERTLYLMTRLQD